MGDAFYWRITGVGIIAPISLSIYSMKERATPRMRDLPAHFSSTLLNKRITFINISYPVFSPGKRRLLSIFNHSILRLESLALFSLLSCTLAQGDSSWTGTVRKQLSQSWRRAEWIMYPLNCPHLLHKPHTPESQSFAPWARQPKMVWGLSWGCLQLPPWIPVPSDVNRRHPHPIRMGIKMQTPSREEELKNSLEFFTSVTRIKFQQIRVDDVINTVAYLKTIHQAFLHGIFP